MRRLSLWLWPLAVALLSLGVTGWLWQHERQLEQRHLRDNFDFGLRQTTTRVEQRMASYEQMLRGLRGLFEASDEVTNQDFAAYVDALLAGADFAGLRNMAYVRLQSRDGPATVAFVAPAADTALDPLGRDLWLDPATRAAMLHAGNSGNVAITRRLQPADGGDAGFLMFMPLYQPGQPITTAAERQARLAGWVMAVFRIGDLMSSLYGEDTPGLEVRIHDGLDLTEQTRIYPGDSVAAAPAARPPRFQAQEYLGFAGHTWTVVAESGPAFERRFANDSARIIAVAGAGLSAVLALLAWLVVTGRQRAHDTARAMTQELRDSTERYRRIVETANEGIWTLDAAGRTSFVNPKMAQLLGYSAPEMLGRHWADFAPGHDPAAPPVADGPHELRLRRKDGSELAALLSTSPITDASGRQQGLLAMVTDVSDRQLAEARRAALEVQLRQSQKMEAIGTLAGGIAHDFNNVLAAILGNVALLQREPVAGDAAQSRLQQIGQAAARARSLVQQIVAFSRQQPQQLQVQPLQPLLEETLALLRSTMPAGVELVLQGCREALWVNADGTQLQQVVMNLCTNAWHALGEGSGRIEVGLDGVDLGAEFATDHGLQAGRHARIWVVDNGCGMDEATRLRVFEPFFTTKPVGQGTGLGLSVVHGIVASHHGAISVASAPGQGSRFEMLFPLAAAPAAEPAPGRTLPDAGPALAGQGEQVLYVDDDPVMVPMVEALLRQQGYDVQCLSDPREALAWLADLSRPLQLLITDFNMPEISGLDVVRECARLRPALPVIISSGFISDELRVQAQALGVRHLLAKEYTLEQLGAMVHKALG